MHSRVLIVRHREPGRMHVALTWLKEEEAPLVGLAQRLISPKQVQPGLQVLRTIARCGTANQ